MTPGVLKSPYGKPYQGRDFICTDNISDELRNFLCIKLGRSNQVRKREDTCYHSGTLMADSGGALISGFQALKILFMLL